MSFGYGVGDIMAISGLALKVYTAYKDAPDGYRNISDEVESLDIIIKKAAQHFESTTLSENSQQEGQKVLKGCQNVLEDLYSLIIKYNSIASTSSSQVLQRIKLGAEDIATLRARLTSNTTLLNGFIQSCDSDEMRARLDNILGLHRTTSRDSIVSLAGSINTKKAYKEFIKDLLAIGVTADMINEKAKEIKDIFKPQQAVANNQIYDSPSGDHSRLTEESSQLPEESTQVLEEFPQLLVESSPLPHESPQAPEVGNFSNAQPSTPSIENKSKSWSRFGWVRPPIDFLVGPLMLAAVEAGDTKRLISTLEYVRNINFTDDQNETALYKAAARGRKDIVQLLLSKGASVEAMDRVKGTPLHVASRNGHTSTVELLTKGTSIEATDKYNCTPLHLAAYSGHTSTVQLLLLKGASTEARSSSGRTPLHYAILGGYTSTAELLLAKGALIDAVDFYIETPLHYAAGNVYTSTVELLLSKGASIAAINKFGNTPLDQAKLFHRTDIAKLLEQKGAQLSAEKDANQLRIEAEKRYIQS